MRPNCSSLRPTFLLLLALVWGGVLVHGVSVTQVHLSISNFGVVGVSWACNRSGVSSSGSPVVLYTEVVRFFFFFVQMKCWICNLFFFFFLIGIRKRNGSRRYSGLSTQG